MARSVGVKHTDIYEQSDYEMPWHDQAPIFQNGGRKVLLGMQLLTLDPITHNNKNEVTYLTQQTPIYNKTQEIIGICLLTNVIAEHKLVKNSRYVTERDKQQFSPILSPYLAELPARPYNLTLNEQTTLYYLLRGYTTEKIAAKLHRSYYTIKDRIDHLKSLFACNTKAELIKQAIEFGYMRLIPASIKDL